MGADFSDASCPQECAAAVSGSASADVVRFVPPKEASPEKFRELAIALLALQRAWFEDAMRRKDERLMSLHAEQMDRLERMLKE